MQAEFFDTAFARASAPPPIGGNGAGWVITANINMNGGTGKEYVSARGRVALQPGGTLGGDLQMSIDNKEVPNNAIRLAIRKSNPAVVVVQRLVAGKPFLGRPAKIVSLPVEPGFNYLSGPIQWTDGDRVLQIFLESQFVKKQEPKPIGARYVVSGSLVVTNSDDGPGDDTVELLGEVYIHLFTSDDKFIRRTIPLAEGDQGSANTGTSFKLQDITIDVFDEEKAAYLRIAGFYQDVDEFSNADPMWNGCAARYKLGNTMTRGATCSGDGVSENLDVTIKVVQKELLYKK